MRPSGDEEFHRLIGFLGAQIRRGLVTASGGPLEPHTRLEELDIDSLEALQLLLILESIHVGFELPGPLENSGDVTLGEVLGILTADGRPLPDFVDAPAD